LAPHAAASTIALMNLTVLRLAALTIAFLGASQFAHANLVIDPSFEANSASWLLGGNASFANFANTGTESGSVNCGSCPVGDDGFVFQNISDSNLADGEDYIVSFWLTSDGSEVFGPGGFLSVFWGSHELYTTSTPLASPNSFVQFQFVEAAEPGDMGFVMQVQNLSAGEFFIDDVSITAAVPEPGTWGLLLAGIAALAWRHRHARSSFNRPSSACDLTATRSSS
jgi:hypothetical protein